MRFIILFLLLVPTALRAQVFTAALDADLTGNGLIDRAELHETDEGGEADLNIWVRKPDGQLDLHAKAKSVVWVGGIGQQPEFAITPHGSLLVRSMNESIGRDRWHQTLTVAWRNDTFVLAGFTYSWYDTLDLENSGTCDVNLLTGKGERTRGTFLRPIEFHTKSRGGPIDKWDGNPPTECFPSD